MSDQAVEPIYTPASRGRELLIPTSSETRDYCQTFIFAHVIEVMCDLIFWHDI